MSNIVINEKGQSRLAILEELMNGDAVSASLVSKRTSLSPATVSRVFKELREKELISFRKKVQNGKGRSTGLYSFNKEYGFLLHYYVTNKAVWGYLADLKGNVLQKSYYDYNPQNTLDDFFSIIKKLKDDLSRSIETQKGEILAAGFSIPGVVNEESRTVYTVPDARQLNNIKFFDYAERMLNVPVIANNVSWLAAVGEKTRVYPFVNSLVYIVFTNQTGIGAGIVYKNELIKGGMHYAGEIGQTWFDQCYSFEDYVAGKGLYEHTASIQHLFNSAEVEIAAGRAPILQELLLSPKNARLSVHLLEEAARAGDSAIVDILDKAVRVWASMIINLNMIINPEIFVLGGCLSTANQYIYGVLDSYLSKINLFKPHVQLSVSGEDSQLHGGLQVLKEYVNANIIFKEALK